MSRSEDAWAGRRVDALHAAAARQADPVAYLRDEQARAEAAYAASGDRRDLALVRAFEGSLDGPRAEG